MEFRNPIKKSNRKSARVGQSPERGITDTAEELRFPSLLDCMQSLCVCTVESSPQVTATAINRRCQSLLLVAEEPESTTACWVLTGNHFPAVEVTETFHPSPVSLPFEPLDAGAS
nr:hypothetical protein Iba_scaffold55368CG0010 [Ipomoea batatas]